MAPTGPRATTAAPRPQPKPVVEEHPPVKGPHPGYISIANQYTLEQKLRRMQKENGCDPAREDNYRLQGVQLIENVRESLQLPVKTFDTACTYYHKFRLIFRDAEYNYQDAALASLFVACKVEDTIKKSKEILCTAYNLKTPEKPTTQDDKLFEAPSKIIIGLERLILETIGFDFRARYPQKVLGKMIRKYIPSEGAREFLSIAYLMSLDIYKTFSPIKQTSFTMILSIMELTALLTGKYADEVRKLDPATYHTSRACVIESMLDLLDLYAQFPKSTKVGARIDLARVIDVKIKLNEEVDGTSRLGRFQTWCDKCEVEDRDINPITPKSATSPATTGSGSYPSNSVKRNQKGGQEGTMRFIFDVDEARREQDTTGEYFKEEYEEYEIEVEEKVPEPHHNNHGGHGHGSMRRDPRHNHHDAGWAPYPRGRHPNDHRPKGRKGGFY